MSNQILRIAQGEDFYSYSNLVRQYPMLTEKDEFELGYKIQKNQCKESAEKLILSHLKLVTSIAYRMRSYGIVLMDLVGEGTIGLMHAVRKFDPSHGKRFSAYAGLWIKAFMQEYIIKSWSLVKIGTTVAQKKLFFHLKKVKSKILAIDNNHSLSDKGYKEVAMELSVDQSIVKEMESRLNPTISLDAPTSTDDSDNSEMTLHHSLADNSETTESRVIKEDSSNKQKELLLKAMTTLDNRAIDIVTRRHLSDKITPLHVLGKEYKISSERVRQIEKSALEKITKYCHSNCIH